MEEKIMMRICEFPLKEGYRQYRAELRTSKEEEWGKEELSVGDGVTTLASASGTLEEIVDGVVLFDFYKSMNNPTYDIKLWEGEYPLKRGETNHKRLITKTPKNEVASTLSWMLREYYKLKRMVANGEYLQTYLSMQNSNGYRFMRNIDHEQLKKFYIELRKVHRNYASHMLNVASGFLLRDSSEDSKEYKNLENEMEAEFLHYFEEIGAINLEVKEAGEEFRRLEKLKRYR